MAPYTTYEGVNVVMTQQSSRYLLKQIKRALNGEACEGYLSYLNQVETLCNLKSTAKTAEEFGSIEHLDKAMAVNSAS